MQSPFYRANQFLTIPLGSLPNSVNQQPLVFLQILKMIPLSWFTRLHHGSPVTQLLDLHGWLPSPRPAPHHRCPAAVAPRLQRGHRRLRERTPLEGSPAGLPRRRGERRPWRRGSPPGAMPQGVAPPGVAPVDHEAG